MSTPVRADIQYANKILKEMNHIHTNGLSPSADEWEEIKQQIESDELAKDKQNSLLGMFYGLQGNWTESHKHHAASIDNNADLINYLNYIITLTKEGDYSLALSYCEVALEKFSSLEVIKQKYDILLETGAFEEAVSFGHFTQDSSLIAKSELASSVISDEKSAKKMIDRFYDFLKQKQYNVFSTSLHIKIENDEPVIFYVVMLPIDSQVAGQLTSEFLMEVNIHDIPVETLRNLHFHVASLQEVSYAH